MSPRLFKFDRRGFYLIFLLVLDKIKLPTKGGSDYFGSSFKFQKERRKEMEQYLSLYEKKGIDPHKSSLKEIFGKIVRNDFLGAFCNIVRSPDRPGEVEVKHADGSGSKSIQRILHHKELNQPEIYQDDVFDAFVMNAGDIACCGFVNGPIFVTQIIAINKFNVDKDLILRQNALGWVRLLELYEKHGFNIIFMGGETADLPDQSLSYILDVDVSSRMSEADLIRGNVEPGDYIFGFESTGQAIWEEKVNSGQGSNGLTLTRPELMSIGYSLKYPNLWGANPYVGKYKVNDIIPGLGMGVSEAILSTTRQWPVLIKMILDEAKKRKVFHKIHGLCMNTGGGLTKSKNLGQGILYIKEIPRPPAFFTFVKEATGENWQGMFQSLNCGIFLEIYVPADDEILPDIINQVSQKSGVKSYYLGRCKSSSDGKNHVTVISDAEEHNHLKEYLF